MGIQNAIPRYMRGMKVFAILSLFAAMGILFGAFDVFDELLYRIEGVTVTAHVTNHDLLRRGNDDSVEYILFYTFKTKEGSEINTNNDFGEDYFRLKVGDAFQLQYIPEDPYVDRPIGSHQDIWLGIVSIIFGLACFVLVRWSISAFPDQFG